MKDETRPAATMRPIGPLGRAVVLADDIGQMLGLRASPAALAAVLSKSDIYPSLTKERKVRPPRCERSASHRAGQAVRGRWWRRSCRVR